MKENAAVKEASTALVRLDPQALIQQAIESGSGIETLERLFDLAKNVRAQQASEAWHRSMAEFQRTCPSIKRSETARITTRTGGSYAYTYAPLGEIMSTILPVMGPLGLSVAFRVRHEKDNVIASCRVSHELGHHEESGEVAMPIVAESGSGAGAMGANPAQRVGIASTYAKRYALLAIIGLAPEDDPDASERPGKPRPIEQPKRKTEQPASSARGQEIHVWTGTVKEVKERKGETKGKPWMLYTVIGADGMEFGTFSETDATFARDAGSSAVSVVWETTAKGGRKIVTIEPAMREPGDEDEDA